MSKMDNFEFLDVTEVVMNIVGDDYYHPVHKHISSKSYDTVTDYRKKIFAKVNKRTGEIQKDNMYEKLNQIKLYYYSKSSQHNKEGTYKMIKGNFTHSTTGLAAYEHYYLFGKEFSKEEWETHPFVIESKLIALGI